MAARLESGETLTSSQLATFIDHTLLKPEATVAQIEALCDEAVAEGFYSVCINSSRVEPAAKRLKDKAVAVCSVVGFPLGAMEHSAKAFETRRAIESGASEIDMVINIGALKGGETGLFQDDIAAVREACGDSAILKVIIETALLSEEEKLEACAVAQKLGAHFVKTSTGFSTAGATFADVALMRGVVGEALGVKAAGGVRSFEDALKMIQSGATRIGTSSGAKILSGAVVEGGY